MRRGRLQNPRYQSFARAPFLGFPYPLTDGLANPGYAPGMAFPSWLRDIKAELREAWRAAHRPSSSDASGDSLDYPDHGFVTNLARTTIKKQDEDSRDR